MKQGRKDGGRPFHLGLVGGQAQEGDSVRKAGGYHAAETKFSQHHRAAGLEPQPP